MKPIFLATDYSPASLNAGDHAAQLAKLTNSELIVFHSWSLPAMSGETVAFPASIDELEKTHILRAEKEAQRLHEKFGVKVKPMQHAGFAADEIGNAAQETHAGLIVMGMQHTNFAGKFFGSVTTAFLKATKLPILVIPEKADFRRPKVMLLATDLHTHHNWHELDVLKEISERFHSAIHILNASKDLDKTKSEDGRSGVRLDNYMKDIPHTWHFGDGNDISESISSKAKEIEADMIVMIHHRLPWYQEIFHHSMSREMTFATDRSLLILHGSRI